VFRPSVATCQGRVPEQARVKGLADHASKKLTFRFFTSKHPLGIGSRFERLQTRVALGAFLPSECP
jgi:hypothetical protein